MSFPIYRQPDNMDCGVTCLQMIAKFHGAWFPLQQLRNASQIGKDGVSLLGISDAAENIGIDAKALQLDVTQLREQARLPCILHWDQEHFVVLYKISRDKFHIADPARGRYCCTESEFREHWAPGAPAGPEEGVALLLTPLPGFSQRVQHRGRLRFINIYQYLIPHRRLIVRLAIGLLVGSGLQLVLPFLSKSLVDVGIRNSNLQWIYLILAGQLALIIGRISIDFIRSRILLRVSNHVSISILADFLSKLLKLPVAYFDSKMTGDILQRMNDHQRIQTFLTSSSISVLFSVITFVVYSVALAMFNPALFGVFAGFSLIYAGWVVAFLHRRRKLDQQRFTLAAQEQSLTIHLIHGMQDIKLHGIEDDMRGRWRVVQEKLFHLNLRMLSLNQWQQTGSSLLNEGKNILITFLAAKAVIDGNMTLGAMLSVQYMIGSLTSPIDQLISFVQAGQNARISMERLNEIHAIADEEPAGANLLKELPPAFTRQIRGGKHAPLQTSPAGAETAPLISMSNLSFTYPGAGNEPVLSDITLDIPKGKTTAIVGMSGSGKTTLVKLLLKIYTPQSGGINVNSTALDEISHKAWRQHCGIVLQDSYIFSDSILRNIALSDEPDQDRLQQALDVANIRGFIDSLPLGLLTRIGAEGTGISMGQRQRILIARAVYRDPEFIFFDEATNSLDTTNESIIMGNLEKFFNGRTVVVVAHRLSTVRNAHQIVVLNKGRVAEFGTHQELIRRKGEYYTLVKNQLELDR